MERKVKARSRIQRCHFLIRNMRVPTIYLTMATCIDTKFQQKKLRKNANSCYTPRLVRTAAMMSLDSSGTDSIVLTNEQINNH